MAAGFMGRLRHEFWESRVWRAYFRKRSEDQSIGLSLRFFAINMKTFVKIQIIRFLAYFGYELVRVKDVLKLNVSNKGLINVLPLIVDDYIKHGNRSDFVFMEAGANDGLRGDPVRPLVVRYGNWRGVVVEPNPALFDDLKNNYAGHSGVRFEDCAITDHDGEVVLYCPNDKGFHSVKSSLDPGNLQIGLCKSDLKSVATKVRASTLATLFAKHDIRQLDLFVTDTEGHDYCIVLQLINQTEVRPSIIQFEHALMNKVQYAHCCKLLLAAGYELLPVGQDTIAVLRGEGVKSGNILVELGKIEKEGRATPSAASG